MIYTGKREKTGFIVLTCEDNGKRRADGVEVLPVLPMWTNDVRTWTTEYGVRQLTLDVFLDYFDEWPTSVDLQRKESGIRAWMPHLAYTTRMAQIVELNQTYHGDHRNYWELTTAQLKLWLDDWSLENHAKWAKAKYGNTYIGEPYDQWEARLLQVYKDLQMETELGLVWKWKGYVCGYQPYHLAVLWLRDRYSKMFEHIRPISIGETMESLRMASMTMVIPDPDDWEF